MILGDTRASLCCEKSRRRPRRRKFARKGEGKSLGRQCRNKARKMVERKRRFKKAKLTQQALVDREDPLGNETTWHFLLFFAVDLVMLSSLVSYRFGNVIFVVGFGGLNT